MTADNPTGPEQPSARRPQPGEPAARPELPTDPDQLDEYLDRLLSGEDPAPPTRRDSRESE